MVGTVRGFIRPGISENRSFHVPLSRFLSTQEHTSPPPFLNIHGLLSHLGEEGKLLQSMVNTSDFVGMKTQF